MAAVLTTALSCFSEHLAPGLQGWEAAPRYLLAHLQNGDIGGVSLFLLECPLLLRLISGREKDSPCEGWKLKFMLTACETKQEQNQRETFPDRGGLLVT